MSSVLEATGVCKRYGGVTALRNARLTLFPGEVHALIGENGAGKSTLARVLAGAIRADSGSIAIDGQPALIANPLDAQRLGIGIIHQELDLFRNLTVGENLVIGNLHYREGSWVRMGRMEAFCRPFLEQAGLPASVRLPVSSLSIGQMQLVAIARALSMNARILLMDEPTSSLFDDAVERLFGLIRGLRTRGVAVVYVSHKMDEIFRICDRVTVLRDGETIGTREVASTNPGELIRMMVGRDLETSGRRRQRGTAGEVVLAVERLSAGKLHDVSFSLRRGEVLGIAGLVGAGRSELGAALFGREPIRRGTIRLRGEPLPAGSARERIRRGIGLVPEDRRLAGLMMRMSVIENGTLAALGRMHTAGFIRPSQESREMQPIARRLALQCPSPAAAVHTLSGGNQQKVLLARWLLLDPHVLFLDDPTRGIDVAARQDIYRIIDELAREGRGVILVSSELAELLGCCDRILVLRQGSLAAEFDVAEATQEKIMTAATTLGAATEDRS